MENINRNRLIGGGVLILSSLLFLPAILTPTKQPLANPNFPISSKTIPTVIIAEPPTKEAEKAKQAEMITLASAEDEESVGEAKQITKAEDFLPQPNSQKELVSIKLESFDGKKSEVRTTKTETITMKKKESWVRVASFSNLANADELAGQLKQKKYPVKIENIKIKNKAYRRVLLGPYTSDEEMRGVLSQIQREGFHPDVQR